MREKVNTRQVKILSTSTKVKFYDFLFFISATNYKIQIKTFKYYVFHCEQLKNELCSKNCNYIRITGSFIYHKKLVYCHLCNIHYIRWEQRKKQ